ncbi:disulfide bond formation protein B [Vreelandella subglaciescola]|jgi:disulfide bond formation protein DsbB|uniref:Disulfide bond formation protein B n=1 Tax=Vreelandella subglaciescola TaxID=29571 RepID=A0A1M7FF98_9GAMM|nr:disulfide bond formation protein B [Halomonas subglaciescola]SHM02327.1 Thiol:disulfide interchange protein DsbB [Halomonas subglaciescola]
MTLSFRRLALGGLALCVLMMAVALGLEHIGGLEPCPLCIFQRVGVIATGLVLAVAAMHNPAGRVGRAIYALLAFVAVAGGAFVAGRHVWLQSLPPDQVPSCGPGLDYMVDVLPMQEVVATVLSGSGECASIDAAFLGLSLPAWTLAGFVVLAAFPLAMLWRALKRPACGN